MATRRGRLALCLACRASVGMVSVAVLSGAAAGAPAQAGTGGRGLGDSPARGRAYPGAAGHRLVERESSREQRALARFTALGKPVYCGGNRGRYVALTFDDGPGPYTPLALRILRRAGAHATFFLVGRNLDRFSSSLPREEAALGAVGDHTWNHVDLLRHPRRSVEQEIARTKAAVTTASRSRVGLFRPPFGARDLALDRIVRSLGLVEVLWSVDTRDAEGASWSQIAANAEAGAVPGAIILMHENRGQTIRALKYRLLPWLRRHRFTLLSVPELLALDPPTIAELDLGFGGCREAPRHDR